ncbi:MAG: molecular chaperone [Proteobacteria bacterium]|nr:molecular chaperone [Pseudomonadota bacterium]
MHRLPALRVLAAALVATLLTAFGAASAAAFQLIPIVMEFAPSGRAATQTFGIWNDAAEPVAVQIDMVERLVGIDGSETLPPAGDRFLVYPNQALVPPNEMQLIQVRWLGEADLARELAFRIIAEQLPVALEGAPPPGGRIDILVRYEGAVYVTPAGATSSLAVEEAAREVTDAGVRLAVTIANRGTRHGVLNGAVLSLRTDAAGIELKGAELSGLEGENVLAGNRRRFLLPWPESLGEQAPSATLRVESAR